MRGVEGNSNFRNFHSTPPRKIDDTMATWSEELHSLTLFDGEAELTPESRPAWQQNMELRTKFVRYPGPRPDGLHPTHFWQRLVITLEVVRKPLAYPDAARDEEQGATWLNQEAPKEPAGVPLQIINDYLLCKVGSGPNPSSRYNLPAVSAFLRLTYYRLVNWAHMLAGGLASDVKEYVRKFSGDIGEVIVMLPRAATKEGGNGQTGVGAGHTVGTRPVPAGEVRTKADLKAAFADLDTVQSQLDEEHERNNKLQDKVRALEKEIQSMRRQALLRPSSPGALPEQASSGGPSVHSNDPREVVDSSPAQLPTISSADGFQGPAQVVCLTSECHRVSTPTSDPRPASSSVVPGL
ncbi:hypothetical protein R1flu_007100 [Riccia fluitans]|uniref:Uncharacterized protein n=1 Tax=Riccia fluitans TaxID=41844 RepID=A0ABD1YXX2_9MARC